MLKLLLNGNEPANQPKGLDGIIDSFYYNEDLFGYLREYTGSVEFFGADFGTLYDSFSSGTCNFFDVDILESEGDSTHFETLYKGLIYVNDIEFDIDRRIARCTIVDDSVIAKISNYFDLKIDFTSTATKNGEPITLASSLMDITDHNGVTRTNVGVVSQFDLLEYCIKYITDNSVGLESSFLNSAPANNYFFTGGNVLFGLDFSIPQGTLKGILTDLCKIWNLRWIVIRSGGQPVIKLEPYTFFNTNATLTELDGGNEIKLKINEELSRAEFEFGSIEALSTQANSGSTWFRPSLATAWAAHFTSNISPNSNCAKRTRISLITTEVCYDTNTISDALNTTERTYVERIFLVGNPSTQWYSNIVDGSPLLNPDITTVEQLKRWLQTYCFTFPESQNDGYSEWIPNDINDGLSSAFGTTIALSVPNEAGKYFNGSDIFHLFPYTNAITIEIKLIIYFDPADNLTPSGTANLSMRPATLTPLDPNEWRTLPGGDFMTLGTPTVGQFYEYAECNWNVGDTITYEAIYDDWNPDTAWFINGGTGAASSFGKFMPGSYIKITSNSYKAFRDLSCAGANFILDCKIPLNSGIAEQITSQQFPDILLKNDFRNYTGKVLELKRNIATGEGDMTLKLRNV